MLDTLIENLNKIHTEVQQKVLPENIRSGVNLFGVAGQYGNADTRISEIVFSDTDNTVIPQVEGPYNLSSVFRVETSVAVYKGEDGQYYALVPNIADYPLITYSETDKVFICTSNGTIGNAGRLWLYRLDATGLLTHVGTYHPNETTSDVINYTEAPKVDTILYSTVNIIKLGDASTVVFSENADAADYNNFTVCVRYTSTIIDGVTYYNTSDASVTADRLGIDKVAYGTQGKITGEADFSNYNALIDGTLNTSDNLMSIIQEIKGELQLGSRTSCAKFLYGCKNLINPPIMDTSNITSMSEMHEYNSKLVKGGEYNTSNVTTMFFMYSSCPALIEIPEYDAGNVKNVDWFVHGCSALTTFGGLLDLGKAYTQQTENYGNYTLDLSATNKLTLESAINVLTKLYDLNLTYDVANNGTLYRQKITFHNDTLALLQASEEGVAALVSAENKGWNTGYTPTT